MLKSLYTKANSKQVFRIWNAQLDYSLNSSKFARCSGLFEDLGIFSFIQMAVFCSCIMLLFSFCIVATAFITITQFLPVAVITSNSFVGLHTCPSLNLGSAQISNP
ncbi:hypothetical protein Pfo_021866 [Paulownia fortunei]|nr:hypothetical protein Pfo_021866 [Paulownia fortunei]